MQVFVTLLETQIQKLDDVMTQRPRTNIDILTGQALYKLMSPVRSNGTFTKKLFGFFALVSWGYRVAIWESCWSRGRTLKATAICDAVQRI